MLRNEGLRRVTTIAVTLLLAALVAMLVLWGAMPAEAAFPGDNGKITFTSDREIAGQSEIYVMDADGDPQTRLTNNLEFDGNPTFAPNGTKIAFDSFRDDNRNIYVMDASDSDLDGNGDNLKRLTKKTASDEEPAFSPDGTKIVFTSLRQDSDGDIYVMDTNPATPGATRLTSNEAFDPDANSSPDGDQIVFRSSRNGTDPSEVYVMDAVDSDNNGEGDNMTNISNYPTANDAFPAFSPDGTKIVFRSARTTGTGVDNADGDYEVFVINVNGTGLTQLTTNDDADNFPDWGPLP